MSVESRFIAYVGPSDIHDGSILQVNRSQDALTVWIESCEGRRFALVFEDVTDQTAITPEGMRLYALNEMSHPPPQRRFVFANWDEEDTARLEIIAAGFRVEESARAL